jgi:molybdate transport system regulatory protein
MVKARLRIRVDFEEGTILSPGKVRLFEMVDQYGSLEKAAATIQMDLDRAQEVIERLERLFGAPLLQRAADGSEARRLRLTELGRKVVDRYRKTEAASALAADRLPSTS